MRPLKTFKVIIPILEKLVGGSNGTGPDIVKVNSKQRAESGAETFRGKNQILNLLSENFHRG